MGRANGYAYTFECNFTKQVHVVDSIDLSNVHIWTLCSMKISSPVICLQDLEDNVTCEECRSELGFPTKLEK